MKEKTSILNNQFDTVHGHVTIDYKDPITGKVKERVDGDNHVFLDQFNSIAWYNWLNTTSVANLFLMDNDTPPSDNFQYLRGNIIGWGQQGASASGNYQGAYNSSESYNATVLDGYSGLSWKYVYDYLPSQVASDIKSVGLSAQYANLYSQNNPTYLTKRIPYTVEANYYVYKDQIGYMIGQTDGIVTKYNPILNTKETIDISSKITAGSGYTCCIGYNVDFNRMYVYTHHNTTANRRMYVFSDETFDVLLDTFNPTNFTNYPSTSRVFLVQDDEMLYWNAGWYHGDFVNNVNAILYPNMSCPYNINNLANTASLVVSNKRAYAFYDYYSNSNPGNYKTMVFDLNKKENIATIGACTRSTSTSYHQQCPVDPWNENGLIMLSNYNDKMFYYKNALSCFIVPPDAPKRPTGSSMQVKYQIDVLYK